jgi:transcriptional regulator GlxA family with amidase domain
MDSVELMKNIIKHAATINEMSKQVQLNKRQFQRESFDLFCTLIVFFFV